MTTQPLNHWPRPQSPPSHINPTGTLHNPTNHVSQTNFNELVKRVKHLELQIKLIKWQSI